MPRSEVRGSGWGRRSHWALLIVTSSAASSKAVVVLRHAHFVLDARDDPPPSGVSWRAQILLDYWTDSRPGARGVG